MPRKPSSSLNAREHAICNVISSELDNKTTVKEVIKFIKNQSPKDDNVKETVSKLVKQMISKGVLLMDGNKLCVHPDHKITTPDFSVLKRNRLDDEARNRGLSIAKTKERLIQVIKEHDAAVLVDQCKKAFETPEIVQIVSNENAQDPMSVIHRDVLFNIVKRLELSEILSCIRVSKSWKSIFNTEEMWKRLYSVFHPDVSFQNKNCKDELLANHFRPKFITFHDTSWGKPEQVFRMQSSNRAACYYCNYLIGDCFVARMPVGQSFRSVHAACYLRYHNLSHMNIQSSNLPDENVTEMINWIRNGRDMEETPPVLGVQIVWRKSYGPKKR